MKRTLFAAAAAVALAFTVPPGEALAGQPEVKICHVKNHHGPGLRDFFIRSFDVPGNVPNAACCRTRGGKVKTVALPRTQNGHRAVRLPRFNNACPLIEFP